MIILNVATESMKLDMSTQKASLNLHTIAPKIHIQAEAARFEMSQPKGDLQIDSTAFRSSYGIKNWQSFSRDNAQEAKYVGLEAIGEIVEEGNRMGQIASGENAIVEIAADSCYSPMAELTWAPLEKPEIYYTANRPDINFVDGQYDLTLERGRVETAYEPGRVNVSVAQYPSIRKWTSENKVDLML